MSRVNRCAAEHRGIAFWPTVVTGPDCRQGLFILSSFRPRLRGGRLCAGIHTVSARARASVRRWLWSSRRGQSGDNRPLYALNWTRLSCHRFVANRVRSSPIGSVKGASARVTKLLRPPSLDSRRLISLCPLWSSSVPRMLPFRPFICLDIRTNVSSDNHTCLNQFRDMHGSGP